MRCYGLLTCRSLKPVLIFLVLIRVISKNELIVSTRRAAIVLISRRFCKVFRMILWHGLCFLETSIGRLPGNHCMHCTNSCSHASHEECRTMLQGVQFLEQPSIKKSTVSFFYKQGEYFTVSTLGSFPSKGRIL